MYLLCFIALAGLLYVHTGWIGVLIAFVVHLMNVFPLDGEDDEDFLK